MVPQAIVKVHSVSFLRDSTVDSNRGIGIFRKGWDWWGRLEGDETKTQLM